MSLIVTTNKLTSKKFLSCLKATDKQQVRNFFHFFFLKRGKKNQIEERKTILGIHQLKIIIQNYNH